MSNLNRHNAAQGPHQALTQNALDAMAGGIRKTLEQNPLDDDTVKAIADARIAEVDAEQAATKAEGKKTALITKHSEALAKLEELAEAPEPIDVDAALTQKLNLEKQKSRVEIIAARLPAVKAAATDARRAANDATQGRINWETMAGRKVAQQVMPEPRGPLVDLNAAAMAWALDRAMHPQKNTAKSFPACTLGEFIDNHFHQSSAAQMVEVARAEISTIIRG